MAYNKVSGRTASTQSISKKPKGGTKHESKVTRKSDPALIKRPQTMS